MCTVFNVKYAITTFLKGASSLVLYLCSRPDDPVVFIYMSKVVTPVAYRNNYVSVVGKLMNLPESLHVCTNSIPMCTVGPAFYNISH